MAGIKLTGKHIQAANRQRRIIFHHDAGASAGGIENVTPDQSNVNAVVDYFLADIDEEGNQIDSVWYDWSEGNHAAWPSQVITSLPRLFPAWQQAGVDLVGLMLEETHKRGREVFFSYRVNGGDHDQGFSLPPMKAEHSEWLHKPYPNMVHIMWDLAFEGVHEYKLSILREMAEMYSFDGISIDFARNPTAFPVGEQWEKRERLTDFMREVRLMLLEIEQQRGRPFLLAARVPENIMGCHYDGMDVETWARERLVDIFVLGDRSTDVDLEAFRRITAGTGIKLYPCWSDHHASDGYQDAPIEVLRGVYANWWSQAPDGVYAFNFFPGSPETTAQIGRPPSPRWQVQREMFAQIGSPETLQYTDKVFYVQRRGGGHGPEVVPSPDDWHTPRHSYGLTNMFAPLPAPLANDGKADTLLTLKVADDVNAAADTIEALNLRVLLSDPAGQALTAELIEVRINNLLLGPGRVEAGWLVFPVEPIQLAVSDNLVGVRVTNRPPEVREEIHIEKLELHVDYR